MTRRTRTNRRRSSRRSAGGWTRKRIWLTVIGVFLLLLVVGGVLMTVHVRHLSAVVHEKLADRPWELPARIYARPLELYPGLLITPDGLARELSLMRYREVSEVDGPGAVARMGDRFTIQRRPFTFEDGPAPSRTVRVRIDDNQVDRLTDVATGAPLDGIRLDPAPIAAIYPTHREDRVIVHLDSVSPLLIQTLIAVEDRDFYRHHGIAPLSIIRAAIANLKALRTVQGGSTLTQQLVKNFFLTRDRTFRRKIDEAIMALILEVELSKDQILEAYLNEVYLGQDGDRAIHGFGLASQFYFGRPLADLRPKEVALLVGMLKGPSWYDPRRHPLRATDRRNTVLTVMESLRLIQPAAAEAARSSGLGLVDRPAGATPFPAYLDLVRRQLAKEYRESDLRSEGLRIFTPFDPQVQFAVEAAAEEQLAAIEADRDLPSGELEVGVAVTAAGGNEVLALLGGRDPRYPGFNRAVDARRPIGSLIKPVVYLTALSQPDRYTLITPIADTITRIPGPNADDTWIPRNYDRQYHGIVPLYEALVHSYNVATVRLGMDLGLDSVHRTLTAAGLHREVPFYPAALLGAVDLSPLEVTEIYGTLAAAGFRAPIRSILAVQTPDGTPLRRYPVTVRQTIDPGAVFLVNTALQAVVTEGTARRLPSLLNRSLNPAGKTGTTNDLKDSWFSGFTGERIATVWVGRDDNTPCGLTGASGALRVWAEIFNRAPGAVAAFTPPQPDTITWAVVDPATGLRTDPGCDGAMSVPFIDGSAPEMLIPCIPADGTGFHDPAGGVIGPADGEPHRPSAQAEEPPDKEIDP